MELFDALHTRRSIRKFTPDPVSAEQVRAILGAAMTAPSAGNARPWRFVVVDDRVLLDEVPNIHQYTSFSRQVPLAILVCGDPSREKYPGFWAQDCAAATQNMLLAVHGLGLGATWCGVYPDDQREAAFRTLFRLPEHIVPMAWVPIGVPAMPTARKDRYDETLVHHNRF